LPGHLAAGLVEGRAWAHLDELDLARACVERVLQTDPENEEARDLAQEIAQRMQAAGQVDDSGLAQFLQEVDGLGGRLNLLERLWRDGQLAEAQALAQEMTDQPKAGIIAALIRLQQGRDEEGTASLHDELAREPSLSVARRLLQGHPLERLLLDPLVGWPNGDLDEVPLPRAWQRQPQAVGAVPMPNAAAAPAGAEPVAESVAQRPAPALDPELAAVQAELDRIAQQLQQREKRSAVAKGRAPKGVQLLVSSRAGLERAFRSDGAKAVEERLLALVRGAREQGEQVQLIYVDDPRALATFQPVNPRSPEAVKGLILQLRAALGETGRGLQSVLLVGGHSVVPPFRLPNPAEDDDETLLTDNPYGCLAGEGVLPAWPVGRLPDAESSRPDLLLRLLDHIAENRRGRDKARSGLRLGLLRNGRAGNGHLAAMGYSASLWREAARSVYGALADPRALRMSPPLSYQHVATLAQEPPALAYFNLHGLAESQCWYGQRDPLFKADYPPFPLALRPADVDGRYKGTVVFSAACYGALCWGPQAENRLASRFMVAGARAFVSSTGTSYGSLMPPVACADLLAEAFLEAAAAGHPVGEALVAAKLRVARTMMERQGFLDGEDQKTLLSFVLYGDPTHRVSSREATDSSLDFSPVEVLLSCDGPCGEGEPIQVEDLAPKVLVRVRRLVQERYPEMEDAAMEVAGHAGSGRLCRCGSTLHRKGPDALAHPLVFRLRKRMTGDGYEHTVQLRISAAPDGRLLKMTVCR
ncbi:MAG: hypothetical protein GX605_11680, partial [Chloroflexi bacterium]|nr:hypothetical protein [Chloroflexota bacterium]